MFIYVFRKVSFLYKEWTQRDRETENVFRSKEIERHGDKGSGSSTQTHAGRLANLCSFLSFLLPTRKAWSSALALSEDTAELTSAGIQA